MTALGRLLPLADANSTDLPNCYTSRPLKLFDVLPQLQ